MRSHILIFVVALCGLVAGKYVPSNSTEGLQRIVGGSKVDISTFAWQASLSANFKFFCGAAIISKDWAITTGFCAEQYFASATRLRAGSNKYNQGGTLFEIQQFVIHPLYERSLKYDIALIKVVEDFPHKRTIRPAKLVEAGVELPVGSKITATGWGALTEGGEKAEHLRAVTLPVIDNETCDQRNKEFIDITDTMFCAGVEEGGKSICTGDFGGPVVDSERTLIGLSSYVPGCARPGLPNVYTRLSNPEIREFIRERTGV